MKRLAARLQSYDDRWICYVNRHWKCREMDWLMLRLTHLGSAGFALIFLLLWGLLAASPIRGWALEGLIALVSSHLVVRLCKHLWHRVRPYLQLTHLHTFSGPLKDYSFPSGHTTAAFSLGTIFILNASWTLPLILPFAVGVGLSRIYLGLHYPTDVAVGAWLGFLFAAMTHYGLGVLS
ncbi:phosphatase PAP2 family protein [Paludifilum halophilum]|uniref:Phosphatidic acid phosphatase type 2/haloperoxidase domain-containing protein n=1 Tax=Paludifilum halophilum TaxID=1642702 RepID=A0A235B679_9BACL|nr:phosphatase PAP2 family protein [Paludifilum halophilum]OYD07803.1 hypothetical protein CHM34_10110 [Paludifilum halophilum]